MILTIIIVYVCMLYIVISIDNLLFMDEFSIIYLLKCWISFYLE
jgi:hypothetical protein